MTSRSDPYRERIYARYKSTHGKADAASDAAYEARVHAKTFGPLLPADRSARIFELGCGSGGFLRYLKAAGYTDVSGMDIDPEHVAAAKRAGVESASAGDAVAYLDGQEGRYDCVVAIDVLEHFRKDELFGVLDSVKRALKPGGTLLWRAPNADGPFGMRVRYGDLTHELAFTKSSARQLMMVAGFDDIVTLPEEIVVTGARSLLRWLLWKPLSALLRAYLFAESYAQDAFLTANIIVRASKPRTSN